VRVCGPRTSTRAQESSISAAHRAADSRAVAEDQHHLRRTRASADELLAWCENNDVVRYSALPRNNRLRLISAGAIQEAKRRHRRTENRRGCSASSLIAREKLVATRRVIGSGTYRRQGKSRATWSLRSTRKTWSARNSMTAYSSKAKLKIASKIS